MKEGVQFWTGSIAPLNLNFGSMYMGVIGKLHAPAALPPLPSNQKGVHSTH